MRCFDETTDTGWLIGQAEHWLNRYVMLKQSNLLTEPDRQEILDIAYMQWSVYSEVE